MRQNDGLGRKTIFERPGFKAWHSVGSKRGDIVYEGKSFVHLCKIATEKEPAGKVT